MFNLSVKLGLEISLHLNICTRWFTNRISYKIHIHVCNASAHGHLRARAIVCVCVCVCVCGCVCLCDISLSVSDVNHVKKEISYCMGTIRRLRHCFVSWHDTNHIPSAPLIFALSNIFVLLISLRRLPNITKKYVGLYVECLLLLSDFKQNWIW
jgi:hypothetical protein